MCNFLFSLCHGSVNKGELSVPLRQVTNLAPFAQVVVYTVMPKGELVADSMDFPISLCLNNKVFNFMVLSLYHTVGLYFFTSFGLSN